MPKQKPAPTMMEHGSSRDNSGGTEVAYGHLLMDFNLMLLLLLLFAFQKEATVPMTHCWKMVLLCAMYVDANQQNLELLPKETPFLQ